jgi:hypothetical protein
VHARSGRLSPAVWPSLVTAAAALTLFGVIALPWLRSGSSRRSSFELFDLVDRLGFAPGGVYAWAVRLWPIVPLAIVVTVVAAWWRRYRMALVLGTVSGSYAVAVGVATRRAPDLGLIGVERGAFVTVVGGLLLVATTAGPLVVATVGIRPARGRAR